MNKLNTTKLLQNEYYSITLIPNPQFLYSNKIKIYLKRFSLYKFCFLCFFAHNNIIIIEMF